MAAVNTPWHYTVNELPPMLSVNEFRALNPDFSATDEQIAAVLNAVSGSVRAHCGWHVSPVLECTYTGRGNGELLMLPSMGVRDVESLTINGDAANAYEWDDDGMVRLNCGCFPRAFRSAVCVYTAGIESAELAQIVSQIASNALVAAPGVSSESAGSVSISYNKTGDGITGGVSLLARDYALLAPYKLAKAV